jgi:hypothetical protein
MGMVHATLNNISFISWRSVLLVEKTGVHTEKITNLPQVAAYIQDGDHCKK